MLSGCVPYAERVLMGLWNPIAMYPMLANFIYFLIMGLQVRFGLGVTDRRGKLDVWLEFDRFSRGGPYAGLWPVIHQCRDARAHCTANFDFGTTPAKQNKTTHPPPNQKPPKKHGWLFFKYSELIPMLPSVC